MEHYFNADIFTVKKMNHTHLSPFNNGMPLPRGHINKNDELCFFDVLQSQLGNHLLVHKGHESLKVETESSSHRLHYSAGRTLGKKNEKSLSDFR